jgi:hypothetical protein
MVILILFKPYLRHSLPRLTRQIGVKREVCVKLLCEAYGSHGIVLGVC